MSLPPKPLNTTGLFVPGERDELTDVLSVAGSKRPATTASTATTAAAAADERPELQVLHLRRALPPYPNGMVEHQSGRHEFACHALPLPEECGQDIGEQLYGLTRPRA